MLRLIPQASDFTDGERAMLRELLADPLVTRAVNHVLRTFVPTPSLSSIHRRPFTLEHVEGANEFVRQLDQLTQPNLAPVDSALGDPWVDDDGFGGSPTPTQ